MTLERVEIPAETVSAVGNVNVPEAGEQVQDMLWELAEKAGPPGRDRNDKTHPSHWKCKMYPTARSPHSTSLQTRGPFASQ